MAIKLDMKEAYDRLEYIFMQKCFVDLDFSSKWIHSIIECITTTNFSVLVNRLPGGLSGKKKKKKVWDKEIRLPYILIIYAEYVDRC